MGWYGKLRACNVSAYWYRAVLPGYVGYPKPGYLLVAGDLIVGYHTHTKHKYPPS